MPEPRPEPLRELTEDWERALVVVAHPDDMEFGAAAAVARWTRQGRQIAYALLTSGEAGIDSMPPERAREVREAEQRESCRIVGVHQVSFLGFPDGVLTYGLELRAAIAEQIRRHRPEILITGNFRETWDGRALNQADHIAAGRACVDAVADAGNRWVFASQLTDGLEPWGGVRQIWAAASPLARHGADITDTFQAGVASLAAHQAYIEGLEWADFDAAEFLEGAARETGTRLGCRFGSAFEVLYMGWGATGDD